jgi:16S rRNA (cytosine1402-N4)-methyltransferase
MAQEVLRHLAPQPGDIILDCTIGPAGQASLIMSHIQPNGILIGIDQDDDVLKIAEENLRKIGGKFRLVNDNFRNVDKILSRLKIDKIDGILLDLGISSLQLENPSRGFSFYKEGPLDMRMDRRQKGSAFELVNNSTRQHLYRILKDYGQERFSWRIAGAIVNQRKKGPIRTTVQLANLVVSCYPRRTRSIIHPATRTFQAIRIAVNRELEALEQALNKCIYLLNPTARICIISFHSLEDRIVKNKLRQFSAAGLIKLLFKKPLLPQPEEIRANPRCRSAKLRVAQKI